ncbi:MAG: hypothetical protein C5B55_14195 [Blastocatellia bacterium]|nr:MAG: hypothetical protein C5B55_14195 [Blastocatellia bacterium]
MLTGFHGDLLWLKDVVACDSKNTDDLVQATDDSNDKKYLADGKTEGNKSGRLLWEQARQDY